MLRPVTAADAGFLREVFASTCSDDLLPVVDMQLAAQERHYRAAYPHATHDLVLVDGQPVGQLRVARDAHAVHLVDIALLPVARGRGIGTQLIRALMDEARAAALTLTLAVFPDSRARGLYERLGFTETAAEGAQITMCWS